MHLYYTGAKEDEVPTISFRNSRTAIDETIAAFDDMVHKIMRKDYSHCANKSDVCRNCLKYSIIYLIIFGFSLFF